MSNFRKFKEYLDQKGKTIEKAVVDASGDTSPPASKTTEPFATKGKVWEDKAALKDKPLPYVGVGEDPGLERSFKLIKGKDRGTAFGDTGDKKLKYEPDTDVDKDAVYGGDKVDQNWPKAKTNNKTESFLAKTRHMSPAQFTNYMAENRQCQCDESPTITAHKTGAIKPDPLQAIKYVTYLADCNENVLETLVHEIKKAGFLNKLLDECLTHQESYRCLAENDEFQYRWGYAFEKAKRERRQHETIAPPADQTEVPEYLNNREAKPGPLAQKGTTPAEIPGGQQVGGQKPQQLPPGVQPGQPPANIPPQQGSGAPGATKFSGPGNTPSAGGGAT